MGEADLLRTGDYFNAVVNRLYYACYYAASALLLNHHIEANTHNGVKTQLSMHFVRTGLFDLEHRLPLVCFLISGIVAIMVISHIVTLHWLMCCVHVRKLLLTHWKC